MNLVSNSKLIAVIDSYNLILYEAEGLKIVHGPTNVELQFEYHERPEKSHGSYDKNCGHNVSASDPHTTPKEIDNQNSARLICGYLDKLFVGTPKYQDLIIAAAPKMLGYIRMYLSKHLQAKVIKEINKDLVNEKIGSVTHAVFG